MIRQTVTIGADGSIQGLQVKPGKGFDLSKLGRAKIVRASEIVHNEETQLWEVHILDNAVAKRLYAVQGSTQPFSGIPAPLTALGYIAAVTGRLGPSVPHDVNLRTSVLGFDSYDEAVSVEIEVLDGFRRQGIHDRGPH